MKKFEKKSGKIYEINEDETTLKRYEDALATLQQRIVEEKETVDKRFASQIQEIKDSIKEIKKL